jgi:hypothetical protein
VSNWPDYDVAPVRRGSLTIWVTEEAVAGWHAPATGKRGGQPVYSDLAIETGLALKLVLRRGLRQIEGMLGSIAYLLGIDIKIPDHTTFSRRGDGLTILKKPSEHDEPPHLLIDSTGLKMYGEGEWLEEKHGKHSRRRWRKLHLAIAANSHEVVAVELTADEVGDVTTVPDLLDQIDNPVASVTGDGAYDADAVYDEIMRRHPQADVIIPPRSTAERNDTTRCASSLSEIDSVSRWTHVLHTGAGRAGGSIFRFTGGPPWTRTCTTCRDARIPYRLNTSNPSFCRRPTMSLTKHLIYRSANGDCWSLMTDSVSGRKFVRHEANPSSGGHLTDTDVEAFLAIGGSGPEFVALRDMLTPSSDDDVATRGPDRGNTPASSRVTWSGNAHSG